jgi:hypothetical protein
MARSKHGGTEDSGSVFIDELMCSSVDIFGQTQRFDETEWQA